MSLYVGNKKYCVVKRLATNTQDILITQNGTYTPQGEVSGYNVVRVQIPEAVLDPLTVTPSLEHQTIEPQNDGFSIVEVEAVTAEIDENIQPENIKKGITILGIDGTFEYILNPLEIEPKTTEQKISPEDGVDGFSDITVKAVTSNIDENILAENIKKGVTILGVEGSVEELNTTTMTITKNGTYKPESPYNGFSEVVIEINTVNNQDIEIVPTTEDQIKTPEEPYTGFGQVTVKGVTAEVDPNLLPENIKKDVEILGVTGTMEGMAPVQEQYTITVDETTDTITKYTPDQGYAGFRDITLDLTWIEEKLQELNAGDTEQTVSLQEITIDEAGEFTPDPGYDGIGKVTVKLDWVDDLVQSKISKYINVTNDQFLTDSISQINTDAVLIRPYACYGMTSVQEVTLTCCEEIGEHAFDECSVESLTIFTPTMCTITETSIPDTIQGIYVPEELVDTYKGDPNWSTFADRIVSIGSAPPRDIDSYRQEVEQYLLTQDIIVADSTDDVDETKQCVLREEFNSVLGNLSPEDIIKEPSEWVFNVIQGTKPNVEERGKIYTKLETYLQSQNYVISEDETTIPPEQQWVAKSKVDNYLDTQTLEELNALTDEDFALVDWDPKPGVLILYEFTIDADETDPTLKISYPETSRNAKFTPAAMDYDNDTFEYGDWKDAFFMPKPVMLDFDGNVDQELVEDNYIQKTQPYMTDETMGEFITTCTQVHEDLQPKQGTWEHENITWDRYYNNIIITRPDSNYNIICIAPKERFVKEFLDMEDIVATTLPNYVKTLVGTLTINVNNTNIVTAITNAKATGDVGKWLTQIQEYLTLYVLNENTCTTCYILGTNDFVALIAQGATIRANYTPAFNNGTLDIEEKSNQLKQDLIAETDKLYQDKNSIYYVPELGDSKYTLNKPTLWGTAVEEDGVISGFSNTSWASFTKPFSPEGNWEVAVQFKLDAINVAQYIFGSNCSYQPFSMSITAANQLYISAYKNNANTVLFAALTSVNTLSDMDIGNEFIARAVYNTETGYYFEIKAVKDSGKTLSVSTSTVEPITGGFGLLFGIDGAGVDVYNAQPLKGCIDIKGSYAKYEVDGEEVYYWKGKEDIDLAKDCTEVDGKYYLTKYIPKEEKWLPAEQFQTCIDTFNKAYNMITNWEKQYTLNSDVANIEFAGNAMVQFPQVWIKYETEQIEQELEEPKTIYHVSVANHKAGDGFNCYTHTNKYGKLVDSIYINIYQPYKDTTTYGTTDIPLMRSISGQNTTVSNTTANEILWAENTTNLSNNITYSVLDLGMVEMLYVLGLLMGKNTNLSSVFGFGVGSGNAGIAKCGDGDQKGLFYGTKTRGVLKYFGIENHWGNYWKVINGLFYTTTDGLLAKLTETQIDGTTVNGYTQDGSGYRKIGLISGTSNNYIQEIKVDEHGIYPSTLSSTAGVQYCDGVWYANNGFAAFGGSYADGEKCGPFAFTLDAGITRSGASTGGSLAAKPNN